MATMLRAGKRRKDLHQPAAQFWHFPVVFTASSAVSRSHMQFALKLMGDVPVETAMRARLTPMCLTHAQPCTSPGRHSHTISHQRYSEEGSCNWIYLLLTENLHDFFLAENLVFRLLLGAHFPSKQLLFSFSVVMILLEKRDRDKIWKLNQTSKDLKAKLRF